MTKQQRKQALEAKRRFWRQHIENQRHSGLTQAVYCRQHDLKLHCFHYWKKKNQPVSEPPPISLVQVQLPPALTDPQGTVHYGRLRLMAAGVHCIEIERDFDPVALRQLLHVLEAL